MSDSLISEVKESKEEKKIKHSKIDHSKKEQFDEKKDDSNSESDNNDSDSESRDDDEHDNTSDNSDELNEEDIELINYIANNISDDKVELAKSDLINAMFDDKKNNFTTMCFGPYQDTYFCILALTKGLSNESINNHCTQIFEHMIRSNTITKKSEKMIFIADGINGGLHILYSFGDKKIMELTSHLSDVELVNLSKQCGKILTEQKEKPVWFYCSTYLLKYSVLAREQRVIDDISEIVDGYNKAIENTDLDIDFGYISRQDLLNLLNNN